MAALVVSEVAEPGGQKGPGRGGCYSAAASGRRILGYGPHIRDRSSPL